MEDDNSNLEVGGASRVSEQEKLLRHSVSAAISAAGGIKKMAYDTGIPRGTLEKYVAETSTPSFLNAARIASSLKMSLNHLAGIDYSIYGATDEAIQHAFGSDALHNPDFIRLPMYNEVHASAGPGAVPVADQANDVVAFGRRFLRDQGAVPDKCSIIWARGTSMEPTIPDGSILVVDHSQSTVEHGCIYVFNVSDRLLVKRARWRMDGKLDLVSDNTNEVHPIETFAADTVEQLRVVGRLVYFCRAP